jgi:hypothetical protein
MKRRALLVAFCLAAAACSAVKPRLAPADVRPGLQKEAESLQADGEKMPGLGARVTWRILSVEVQEQPDNTARPFRGTVRMRIESERQEPDGTKSDAIEKTFTYVYDAAAGKWTFGS